jgi:hypothetical protein
VSQKKRPGPLWMFFYGRRRRGFPWLLVGIVVAVVVLGLTFAIPGGADVWRGLAPIFLVALIVAVIVSAVAIVRERPRRR